MTAPHPTPQPTPEPVAPLSPAPPGIRAVDGNRAALTLLVVQNVVSALLMAAGVPLGTALLGAFALVVLVALTIFREVIDVLRRDTRWRTPPAWGTALAAFVLAFLASRAFVLAVVTLFPESVNSVPQFLSRGADLWVLLLAAGLLIPFAEEVAFRGLLMRGHERAAGFTVAALTSTVVFSLAHGAPASVAGILPLAYVLARVAQHTGSLWNSVIIHALNNTLAVGLGAFVAGRLPTDTAQATDLLQNPALKLPLALGSLLFGTVVLAVLHLWLTPRPDPQARSAPGPWLSAALITVLLFGVVAALATLPAVTQWLTDLRGALR
ncbi:CPBP family intramembrane glutamic endopeptidase [Deinococcus arcticus]|uniref:CPBP family intramembrane metalloprotease domain-containing protein n=1 Tax=Deinococcus arcticus TaxID=2136176 RepID=A0A2T3W4G7_9DEIO|nr:type II CAAX endopeptidase family protein [Deinococcus arcticus]PTA66653.1 CPBP family intramembrane metalloprotease domain-containing protein [Deinococcus arcticus]